MCDRALPAQDRFALETLRLCDFRALGLHRVGLLLLLRALGLQRLAPDHRADRLLCAAFEAAPAPAATATILVHVGGRWNAACILIGIRIGRVDLLTEWVCVSHDACSMEWTFYVVSIALCRDVSGASTRSACASMTANFMSIDGVPAASSGIALEVTAENTSTRSVAVVGYIGTCTNSSSSACLVIVLAFSGCVACSLFLQ